jgi:hypothetical protein
LSGAALPRWSTTSPSNIAVAAKTNLTFINYKNTKG